jgi:NCAIR mutase (PurE)-related protein
MQMPPSSPPDGKDILSLFERVAAGELAPDDAARLARFAPFEQLLDGLSLDTHRALRTGFPETVLARGKSTERLILAVGALSGKDGSSPVLATRVSEEQGGALAAAFPAGSFWPEAGLFACGFVFPRQAPWPRQGEIMILTAGASDMPVALEALGTALFHGFSAGLAPDAGVCGLHRLRPWLPALDKARILIVAAGMEGALPGVIAGLTDKPVIAVPTSVGYGVSAGGFAALAGMLSACAPGICVVNIDNGYGAAMVAARLLAQFRCRADGDAR